MVDADVVFRSCLRIVGLQRMKWTITISEAASATISYARAIGGVSVEKGQRPE
jgi:hypothetical protein